MALLLVLAAVMLFVLLVGGGMAFVIYLLVRDTSRREGKWGVNLQATGCPRCGAPLPRVRAPRSIRQALWGGWTCVSCGCEMDKWGREFGGG